MTNEQFLIDMMINNLGKNIDFFDDEAKADLYTKMKFYLGAAREFIAREGVTLDTENSNGDCMLVVQYACFLYDGGDREHLPPNIRKPLNDRIMQEDVTGYNPDAVPLTVEEESDG